MKTQRSTVLGVAAVLMVLTAALLGFTGNILAYDDSNTEITSITITFNDGNSTTFNDGDNLDLNENQTVTTIFDIAGAYYYDAANSTTPLYIHIVITAPDESETDIFISQSGSWSLDISGDERFASGNYTENETYVFSMDGTYELMFQQVLFCNYTVWSSDTWDITIFKGDYADFDDELGIGDLELMTMSLGFIGVIGFVATPMVAAKLMGGKDPIVVISAFLICMIMFGTLVYVFLLGGS